VDGERKKPKHGSLDELFGQNVIGPADGDGGNDKDKTSETDDGEAPDEASQRLNELLSQETSGRGHPKALC
jgi:hypothetical protein